MGLFNFDALRTAKDAFFDQQKSLQDELTRIDQAIEKCRQDKEAIEDAPTPNREFADVLMRVVDQQAEKFKSDFVRAFAQAKNGEASICRKDDPKQYDLDRFQRHLSPREPGLPIFRAGKDGWESSITDPALFLFFGDAIKAGISKLVEEFDDDGAIPLAERPGKLQAIEKKVEKLKADRAKLQEEAAGAGFVIRHGKVELMNEQDRRMYEHHKANPPS